MRRAVPASPPASSRGCDKGQSRNLRSRTRFDGQHEEPRLGAGCAGSGAVPFPGDAPQPWRCGKWGRGLCLELSKVFCNPKDGTVLFWDLLSTEQPNALEARATLHRGTCSSANVPTARWLCPCRGNALSAWDPKAALPHPIPAASHVGNFTFHPVRTPL